jgi:hypothetical protein
MYRAALDTRLARLELLLANGQRRIKRQECVIADLEKLGRSTIVARKLLLHLEEIQRSHQVTRDLLASRMDRL